MSRGMSSAPVTFHTGFVLCSLADRFCAWLLQMRKLWICLPFRVQRKVCPLPTVCPTGAAEEAEVLLAAAECG